MGQVLHESEKLSRPNIGRLRRRGGRPPPPGTNFMICAFLCALRDLMFHLLKLNPSAPAEESSFEQEAAEGRRELRNSQMASRFSDRIRGCEFPLRSLRPHVPTLEIESKCAG